MAKLLGSVGVVIGRFQIPELHSGHRHLIDYVSARHETVLVLVGYNNIRFTEVDPFPPQLRMAMVSEAYPSAVVQALPDSPVGNAHWSQTVDAIVATVAGEQGAVLYGSRDSFIPKYSGVYPTHEVPELPNISATTIRAQSSAEVVHDAQFRQGWLSAINAQFAVTDPTVDVAIVSPNWERVLMGQRGEGALLRFIGGFVDPNDESYEVAAVREQGEEVLGIAVSNPVYIGSRRIRDPRYGRSRYGVMTTFFALVYQDGTPVAGDDMGLVEWVDLSPTLRDQVTPTHHDLFDLLLAHRTKVMTR